MIDSIVRITICNTILVFTRDEHPSVFKIYTKSQLLIELEHLNLIFNLTSIMRNHGFTEFIS